MIKPDWNLFKTKFSENPQSNFQWFCYLLFCKEFNKTLGISRYKNQSGIETDPIAKDGETIGWQAKFYETALSKNKDDLIETLVKSKRDYPALTKIIFYTNQEWGQNKGQEPKGKKDTEQKAKDLNIVLEYRTASYFESPFVAMTNEDIARHFFSLDKNVFDLINEKKSHSENILYEIQADIDFNNQKIEIDRNDILENLQKELKVKQAIILSGVGGVGKTAVIKSLYKKLKDVAPFYIFKASEFNAGNINHLYGNFTAQTFMEVHKDDSYKIIVIDSAENLLYSNNTDPFKEFLSLAIRNDWKLVFTTRDSYLDDLNSQFFEIYKIIPLNIHIQNLGLSELNAISEKNHFSLPKDEKLVELLKNPFYLSEYLGFYKSLEETNYVAFKEKLWNKIIKKSKPERERCFLQIAINKANEGQFFVAPICESNILDDELKKDGILGYETAGYFITHDIYEEWALEKFIETEFKKRGNDVEFFNKIGSCLSIRRSFRNWISEKLLLEKRDMQNFIIEIIRDNGIESFWKDEALVSVLLSSYSESFFKLFQKGLLENGFEILKKLAFLLRIACKEVDEEFFKQLGINNLNLFSLKYVLTKPKGQGWLNLIKFAYENLNQIGVKNILFLLPVIHDWNNKFKIGETTKFSSLIALEYYKWQIKNGSNSHHDNRDQLLQTILWGSAEIKNELKEMIDEIIRNKWKNHRDPYSNLSKAILTKLEGIVVSKVLPESVLKLADLFWFNPPNQNDIYHYSGIGIEKYFDMDDGHLDYFPASSYQTPIYWLLQSSFKNTIDFILEFTNKVVECFAKSDLAKQEVEEIEVFIGIGKSKKQYICNRLWCTYRGSQGSPHVLESMHMALEKYFLECGKYIDSSFLESWLLYILQNSKSASLSGVIVSIALAYPEKTFNVARVLFKTKKFFSYDTSRFVLDRGYKSTRTMLKSSFGINPKDEMYENERKKADDESHRKYTLEQLFINYQFFKTKDTPEEEVGNRQKILWEILDDYYKELNSSLKEKQADNSWRLCLARMDRRKMNPTTEQTEGGFLIHLNPEIEPELKKYSEKSLENISESTKYNALNLWAYHKIRNDEKHKQYLQYENNHELALKEVKEIIHYIRNTIDNNFYLLNGSIPSDVCSVLLRDYFEELSKDEKIFCKDIVLGVIGSYFKKNYQYQVADGMQSSISVLPVLLNNFPEEKEKIKEILLLILFDDYPVDMANTNFNIFSITAIHQLWASHFGDAQSLLFGYLLLKPRYEELRKRLRQENHKKEIYDLNKEHIIQKLLEENEREIKNILKNKISMDDLGNIEKTDLCILKTAFQLIPTKTDNKDHKIIVQSIIIVFTKKLLLSKSEKKLDYSAQHIFLEKLAYFVLSSSKIDIPNYLKPIIDKFNNSEAIADLFREFILAEDRLDTYENFWIIWNLLYEKVIGLCANESINYHTDQIIMSYLFAKTLWNETATSWHTFKDRDRTFFEKISNSIGHRSSVLYSISKVLNEIGSMYLEDGISWISLMIDKNKNLWDSKFENDTIYYLENIMRKHIYKNREKIKKTNKLKLEALTITSFLIENGSVVGYLLREKIL
jgi:hypothetical protein